MTFRVLALLAVAIALLPAALPAEEAPARGNRPVLVLLPGGEFEMGDHHDLGGREHPSDEVPLHVVRVAPFAISATETTNAEYVAFLNAALAQGAVAVRDGLVVAKGADIVLCDTRASDPASRIAFDGRSFSVPDGFGRHPATGLRWHGAAAYTNWLSEAEGLPPVYDARTFAGDLSRPAYRLPTEAEWEYAALGGKYPPYPVYPWGNEVDPYRANLPRSRDPFEAGPAPHTTPVGFFDGSLRKKADFGWPSAVETYQTKNGANGFGLFDMAGNVWEWCHDWYGRDAYASATREDPAGPAQGTPMPDGVRYHVLRGGNWMNGDDGHSRVSNRNCGYYRGPGDPNHSYYHVGFRVVLSGAAKPGTARSAPAAPPARPPVPAAPTAAARTVGLLLSTPGAAPGYTLFAPKHNTETYLMDNAGRVVRRWKSDYEPGQSVYLLPNGHLLHCCFTKAPGFIGGGEGGRLEEFDWDGNLVWEFTYSDDRHLSHHDIEPLPNGNILLLAVEKRTAEECAAAGIDPSLLRDGVLYPDTVIEVEKTGRSGGKIVWEWRVWDHLVQDRDPTKANYGDPAEHPGRMDVGARGGRPFPAFMNHMNSIDYHPEFDQILLSVRGSHEVWVIDHSTTTEEAAGRSGGRQGKGGDLLYRWGNPVQYRAGTERDQALFDQHDARWIDPGLPGAGNILIFNNGNARGYSSVVEIEPPVDRKGRYARAAGRAFGPERLVWEYAAKERKSFYSEAISGAARLPGGTTLICDGVHGLFFEVTPKGETVWEYVNPVVREGPLADGETPGLDQRGHQWNAVFKIDRYPPDFAGFSGKTLTPGDSLVRPASVPPAPPREEPRRGPPPRGGKAGGDRPPREGGEGGDRPPRGGGEGGDRPPPRDDRGEGPGARDSGPRRPWLAVHFTELDADGDGVLLLAAALAHAREVFAAFDRDHDGRIGAAERSAGPPPLAMGGFVDRHFAEVDADSSGEVSEAEVLDAMRRMFSGADRDGDGVLAEADVEDGEAARPEARGPVGEFRTDVPDLPFDAILGRPTATSIVLSLRFREDVSGHVEIAGGGAGVAARTSTLRFARDVALEVPLTGLDPGTRYEWRFRGDGGKEGPGGAFRTAPPAGTAFTFAVQADSHLDGNTDPALYSRSLLRALADAPDFLIDLGDTFMTDKRSDHRDAAPQYLAQRHYLGLLCRSAPLFLVPGNHDGEGGGERGAERTAWAAGMRARHFPSPATPWALTWGDALLVGLDPYAASERGRGAGRDPWGITLGDDQYQWLERTLAGASARHKFVFIHNLPAGRGGAEASVFYEWGGRNADGTEGFAARRPGWGMPVHDLLVRHGVSAVFHGHDHLYAKQERGGLVYQCVPQPGRPRAEAGRLAAEYGYASGEIVSGSGYLRVRVDGRAAAVEFVRAEDGTVAAAYALPGVAAR